MKVFISAKVPRGDQEIQVTVSRIAEAIRQTGHTPFVAYQEILDRGLDSPQDFMPFVRGEISACGLMIVIYHPELRGGLIEMGLAYAGDIPIWLFHKTGEKISSSALGCADRIVEYDALEELTQDLANYLARWEKKPSG